MKVIVAGAGQVGFNIARYLAIAGNDVTVIDQRRDLVEKIAENLDIQAMTGYASHPGMLDAAGARDADMLIAVTLVDEINMVACQVAHTFFNVPTKIARIRQKAYLERRWSDLFRRDHLPIDHVISPEREVAHAVALRLEVPGASNVVPFADNLVRLIVLRCTESTPITRTPLRQLTYLFPDLHVVVVAILRGERFFIPDGDDELLPQDEVHLIVDCAHISRLMPAFGMESAAVNHVVIAGGGNIGLCLAEELEHNYPNINLKLMETKSERADYLADYLEKALIIKGDAREREILDEVNIASANAMIAVTNDDEVNIMGALLAKQMGCERVLALVNNSNYNQLLPSVGIDAAINPRETTVSSVLRHVRRGRIKAVHSLRDGEAEVLEAEALETSALVGRELRSIGQIGGMIVGALVRDNQVLTPRSDTVVKAHDRVVLVAQNRVLKKVEQLFSVSVDYF